VDDGDGAMALEGGIERGKVQNIAPNEWTPAHEIGMAS
jgi:hypothetical protein